MSDAVAVLASAVYQNAPTWFELLIRSVLNTSDDVDELAALAPPVTEPRVWAPFLATLNSVVGAHPLYAQTLARLGASASKPHRR